MHMKKTRDSYDKTGLRVRRIAVKEDETALEESRRCFSASNDGHFRF